MERLHDEVALHPAILRQHAQAISVEDAHHAHLGAVHAPAIKTQV